MTDALVVWKRGVLPSVAGAALVGVEFLTQSTAAYTFNVDIGGLAWSVPEGIGETSYGDFTLPASGTFSGGGLLISSISATGDGFSGIVTFPDAVEAILDEQQFHHHG